MYALQPETDEAEAIRRRISGMRDERRRLQKKVDIANARLESLSRRISEEVRAKAILDIQTPLVVE